MKHIYFKQKLINVTSITTDNNLTRLGVLATNTRVFQSLARIDVADLTFSIEKLF